MKSISNIASTPPAGLNPETKPALPFPWSPDQGDGTFRNPIICADYSDPDVIRVGGDFYMTASSFNSTPGLPLLHSRDLVNWTLINHAVKNLPQPRYAEVHEGCGIWAPAIRFHAGRFYIFFAMPDEGIYMTTTQSPAAKWSEPHLVHAGKGLIDPCPLWDDDGRAYLVHAFAQSRAGIKHRLCVRSMKPDATQLFGDEKIIFHAPERQPTIEGPKFLKKDGWYYILAPAGGVKDGWQVALRSKNIFGPYEDKTVLQQGATSINGPHQGALVDLPNGEWWFAHFQDVGVYGRIVHLQPVIWKNDWPMMGCERDGSGIGEPVLHHRKPGVNGDPPVAVPQTSDEFASPQPGLQWQWHANHRDDWASTTVRPGWLRLASQPVRKANLAKAANLLLQKFPARSFAVETELEFHPMTEGEEAGLVVMGGSYAALCLRKVAGKLEVIFRNNGVEQLLATNPENRVILCVRVDDGGVCRFGFVGANGEWMEIKSLFQAQAGTWIGAKVGLYSLYPAGEKGGHADFNHFRFQPIVVTEFFDAKKMRTGRA